MADYSWIQLYKLGIVFKWVAKLYLTTFHYVEMKLLGSVYESVTDDKDKMDNYSWLQLTTADYSQLQWILTAVKDFLRSTYPIEQLSLSEVWLKGANYRQLQQITADYRWLQWILTAVYGFLRSTYPIEQLWFCEVRLNEATWFSLEECDKNANNADNGTWI